MRQPDPARVPWALLLVLAAAVAGCGTEEDPNVDRYELSGYVLNDLEGGPIGGAMVIFRSDTLRMGETTTDGDGLYEMVVETDIAFGQVRAEAAGFQGG